MKRMPLALITSLGTLLLSILLLNWAGTADSPFYYRLDALVGGEGSGGDGDAFYMLSALAVVLNLIATLILSIKAVTPRFET